MVKRTKIYLPKQLQNYLIYLGAKFEFRQNLLKKMQKMNQSELDKYNKVIKYQFKPSFGIYFGTQLLAA